MVARRKPGPAAPALNALRPRVDLEIDYDGRGFVLGPPGAQDEARLSRKQTVEGALKTGRYLPVWIGTKSVGVVRLVLGVLDETESAEWVGRLVSRLTLPGGRLSVWDREVAVPAADYLVEVLCFLPMACSCDFWTLKRPFGAEPLASQLRAGRPGESLPAWLVADILGGFEPDPGHEAEWKALPPARKRRIRAEAERGGTHVDVLVRLDRLPANWSPSPVVKLHEQWIPDWETRRPEPLPLGLAAARVIPLDGAGSRDED